MAQNGKEYRYCQVNTMCQIEKTDRCLLSYHSLAAKKVVACCRLSVSRSGRSFFDRSHSERKMRGMILSPSCHVPLDVRGLFRKGICIFKDINSRGRDTGN